MVIANDALIETAASGSATLTRGDDRIIVAPNSRLRLPAQDASGLTRVIEEFGELFFQVGKRTQPHFRVDTPLLAATVKGTSFTVAVDEKGTQVQVRDGLVLVQNSASEDATYVPAGRTASVVVTQPMDLFLDRNVVPPAKLRLGNVPSRANFSGATNSDLTPLPGGRSHSAHSDGNAELVPDMSLVMGKAPTHHSPASAALDSTLSGIGVGILAAALAIMFVGTNRRRPGLVETKARRASGDESNKS
jgi:hypothetical protein